MARLRVGAKLRVRPFKEVDEPYGAKAIRLWLIAAQVLATLGISDFRSQFCYLRFAI